MQASENGLRKFLKPMKKKREPAELAKKQDQGCRSNKSQKEVKKESFPQSENVDRQGKEK